MYSGRGFYGRQSAGAGANKTINNPAMLRFRPIAPKPVAGSSESPPEKKSDCVKRARPKRKYVRASKNRCKTKKEEDDGNDEFDRTVSTQQMSSAVGSCGSSHDIPMIKKFPIWLNFDSTPEKSSTTAFSSSDRSDQTAVMPPPPPAMRVVESCVTVECVTDACMDGGGLGNTDVDRIRNLEEDTCPAFVSDGVNRVQWVNLAYRNMVWAEEGGATPPPEAAVLLVVKAEVPAGYPAFACRVRVEYTWRKGRCSRIMPCDVWRMEFGGFAWRLDVKAALSLGR